MASYSLRVHVIGSIPVLTTQKTNEPSFLTLFRMGFKSSTKSGGGMETLKEVIWDM